MSNIIQFPKKLSIPEEQEEYYDLVHEKFGGEYPELGQPRKVTITINPPEKTASQKAGEFALGAILASCFVMLVFVVFF